MTWRSEENPEFVFSKLIVEFDEQDNCHEMMSKKWFLILKTTKRAEMTWRLKTTQELVPCWKLFDNLQISGLQHIARKGGVTSHEAQKLKKKETI